MTAPARLEPRDAAPLVRYVVVTPARDEAAHVHLTLAAMAAQTVLPLQWVIVNDGSTDATGAIVDAFAATRPWVTVIHRRDRGFRAPGSGVVDAVQAGCRVLRDDWELLVKLDADLSFGVDYFGRCAEFFQADPRLGIGGGTVCRMDRGALRVDSPGDPKFHVRGATKIYRRACWDAIAPLPLAPGWDTIDEVRANLRGWTTRTFTDASLVQHKPTGGADGAWRNAFKNGVANHVTGYHPLFMAGKCVKRIAHKPFMVESLALAAGYCSAWPPGGPRQAGDDAVRYLRAQQVRRMLGRPSIYG
jgi:glycosyltransferase involved in cell wall biosynthesis